MKYAEIRDRIVSRLNYENFKSELLKKINTNGAAILKFNKVDMDNGNGEPLDVMKLIHIIDNDEVYDFQKEGVYCIYIHSNAYEYLKAVLSVLKKKSAAIIGADLNNYASLQMVHYIVADALRDIQLNGAIVLQNGPKEHLFEQFKDYMLVDLTND